MLKVSAKSFRQFQMRVDTFEAQIQELIGGIDHTSIAVRELNFDFDNLVKNLNQVKHSDDDFHVGESIMDHMKMVLKNINDLTKGWSGQRRNMLRLTAFLHDIAKPETFTLKNNKATFYGHPDRGYAVAKVILSQFSDESEELREYVAKLVKYHHSLYQLADARTSLPKGQLGYLKGFIKAGLATQESLKDLSTFARADSMTPKALAEVQQGIKVITEDIKALKVLEAKEEEEERNAILRREHKLKDKAGLEKVLRQHIINSDLIPHVLRAPSTRDMNQILGKAKELKALKALAVFLQG